MGGIPSSTKTINIKFSTGVSPLSRGETISAPTTANYSAWYRSKDIYQLLSERQKLQKQIQKLSTDPSGYSAYREKQLRQQMAVLDVYLTGQSKAQLESAVLGISTKVIGASTQASYIRAKIRQAIDYSVQSRTQVSSIKELATNNVNTRNIPKNGFNKRIKNINCSPNTTPRNVSSSNLQVLWGSKHSQVVKALEQRLNMLRQTFRC